MADPRLDVLANLPLFAALHTGVMQNSEGGSAGTTGGPLILWPTYRTMLAPGGKAISPGADGLCTISALTQLEARLIDLTGPMTISLTKEKKKTSLFSILKPGRGIIFVLCFVLKFFPKDSPLEYKPI